MSMKYQIRPYHHDSTASRLLSEVKHDRDWLVLRWGTTLEYQLMNFIFFYKKNQNLKNTSRDIPYLVFYRRLCVKDGPLNVKDGSLMWRTDPQVKDRPLMWRTDTWYEGQTPHMKDRPFIWRTYPTATGNTLLITHYLLYVPCHQQEMIFFIVCCCIMWI